MDLLTSLPAFLVAVALISASPGPAMALILRRAALRGFRGAVPTVLGLEAGAVLALVQVAFETACYLALAAGVARAGTWFRRPAIRRRLEAVSGTVLVGLGLRVAASSQ